MFFAIYAQMSTTFVLQGTGAVSSPTCASRGEPAQLGAGRACPGAARACLAAVPAAAPAWRAGQQRKNSVCWLTVLPPCPPPPFYRHELHAGIPGCGPRHCDSAGHHLGAHLGERRVAPRGKQAWGMQEGGGGAGHAPVATFVGARLHIAAICLPAASARPPVGPLPAANALLPFHSFALQVVLYDLIIEPFFRKRGRPITVLQRIGAGCAAAPGQAGCCRSVAASCSVPRAVDRCTAPSTRIPASQ